LICPNCDDEDDGDDLEGFWSLLCDFWMIPALALMVGLLAVAVATAACYVTVWCGNQIVEIIYLPRP
jgi:hypothetical protein